MFALVVLVLSLPVTGLAQESASTDENSNSAGGIYTEDQAKRGQQAYFQSCASCHGIRLNGGMGPALTGDPFMSRWGPKRVQELFDFVQENMPLGLAGTLSDQAYADIVAFILSNNGHPAGSTELTAESEALGSTRVDPDAE